MKTSMLTQHVFVPIWMILLVGYANSAFSQGLQQCVRELVQAGVNPNTAADKCLAAGARGTSTDAALERYERCVDKMQYTVLKGNPKLRRDGKTEFEYSSIAVSQGSYGEYQVPSWLTSTGANCWLHGFFRPKILCWDSEVKMQKNNPREAARACRSLAPKPESVPVHSSGSPGSPGANIIINQTKP